jgi:Rieske Fe-S protein
MNRKDFLGILSPLAVVPTLFLAACKNDKFDSDPQPQNPAPNPNPNPNPNPDPDPEEEQDLSLTWVLPNNLPLTVKHRDTISIEWEAGADITNVVLAYTASGSILQTIATVAGNASPYLWNLPETQTGALQLAIYPVGNPTLKVLSGHYFTRAAGYTVVIAEHPELADVGGSKIFESTEYSPFEITKEAAGWSSLSMVCTHSGCIIDKQADNSFDCACHGSKFTEDGEVTQGPANRDLDTLTVVDNGTYLTVTG